MIKPVVYNGLVLKDEAYPPGVFMVAHREGKKVNTGLDKVVTFPGKGKIKPVTVPRPYGTGVGPSDRYNHYLPCFPKV